LFKEFQSDHWSSDQQKNHELLREISSDATKEATIEKAISAQGGHWEYVESASSPYTFSSEVCDKTYIVQGDCTKTVTSCPDNLMNWQYVTADGKTYPKFSVSGFRSAMRNKNIVFVGDSTARQQVQALVWTLGHEELTWEIIDPPFVPNKDACTTQRHCMRDALGNITICFQPMGSMSTQVYKKGNYTLVHSLRGLGDTSCLLYSKLTHQLIDFDLVFVQGITWWQGLPHVLNSTTSPFEWVSELVPTVYKDAMGTLLSHLSGKTKTVLVLGQVGTVCSGKTEPEEFDPGNIPGSNSYGWSLAPQMWSALLNYLDDENIFVQIVDARDPTMQSVHAHPEPDCLHFCMNSAAVNIYLDMYWNEVFSNYIPTGN
jgi:hypothetical protein